MKKVTYDPTVTLGHVIQVVTILIALLVGILRFEFKVAKLEETSIEVKEAQKTQAQVIVSMDKAITKLTWIVEHK